MKANINRTAVPVTQPNWAIAQARDKTPDPITAVIICALAVSNVPATIHIHRLAITTIKKHALYIHKYI